MSNRRPATKPLTQNEIETALMLVSDGRTIRQIAEVVGCHPGTIQRHLLLMDEEYEGAKEKRRDLIRAERWERAFDRKDRASAKFLDDLAVEQLPEAREARRALDAPTQEDDRAGEIAAAIDRFTALVVSRFAEERPELPAGKPQ